MKLLIAYDGSPCADAALADLLLAGLPERVEARVVSAADVFIKLPGAVGAVEDSPLEGFPDVQRGRELAAEAFDLARKHAADAAERVRALFPEWIVSHEAYADSPAWAIVHAAEQFKADVAVVGSHSRGVLGRLVLGSVSQKVLSYANCAVRVARCREKAQPPTATRPVKILVGIDGSREAMTALSAVAGRKWPAGSEARVLLVQDLRLLTSLAALGAPGDIGMAQIALPAEVYTAGQRWVAESLKSAGEELSGTGLTVTTESLEGDPKHVLLEESERWGADVIFVGAKGMSRIERFLLGSVSSSVAARAHCTVEVVRFGQRR
jgi:nucleotide-binding universal stress UspA family protein